MSANHLRGEAELSVGGERLLLRPTFANLVAAEQELGSLFGLVERAAEGRLMLSEVATLFWHCIAPQPSAMSRERVGEALAELGLARVAPVLKTLVSQILAGRV